MSVVQSKSNAKTVNSADHSVTFDSAPTEGNLLVAFISHRNTSTCADLTITGWTEIECGVQGFVGKGFYKIAGASESSTVTIDTNAVSAAGFMAIIELDNIDSTGTLNVSSVTSSGLDVTTDDTTDVTTTEATTQLLCFVGVRLGGDAGSFSFTDSFVKQEDGEGSGASPSGGGVAYRRVTSTGTYGSTITWTDAGRPVTILVAFKEAAGGPTYSQAIAGSITSSGSVTKKTTRTLLGTTLLVGAVSKITSRLLISSITTAGTLVASTVIAQALSGNITPSGTIAKKVGKALSGSLTMSGAISKKIFRVLSGNLTLVGVVSTVFITTQTIVGSLTISGIVAGSIVIITPVIQASKRLYYRMLGRR